MQGHKNAKEATKKLREYKRKIGQWRISIKWCWPKLIYKVNKISLDIYIHLLLAYITDIPLPLCNFFSPRSEWREQRTDEAGPGGGQS